MKGPTMTALNRTTSPFVERALAAGQASGHSAKRPVEPTLGDRIPADRPKAVQFTGDLTVEALEEEERLNGSIECLDCRGTFRLVELVPFGGCEADPDDDSVFGMFVGEPACPLCGGLL